MTKEVINAQFESLIFEFRGMKVMIDSDLAALYDVPTKRLKEQVKRNISRFPQDFMFELNNLEKLELVANCDRLKKLKHSSVNPTVFTEQGVAMLSSVINSERAIQINIGIMRVFAQYRSMLRENADLKKDIIKLDEKLNKAFQFLLGKIDELHQKKQKVKPVGYKYKSKDK
ncbi:MAG: ORF6N domain-containing protein [Bacteroidia bacterium]|nr:ORF6N domain-containing protein [Bacteroidia bacterium]